MNQRRCFYVPRGAFEEGKGYVPSMVVENEPGHTPMRGDGPGSSPWYWGMTYEEACKAAEEANAKLGITPEDAIDIVSSSMAASR